MHGFFALTDTSIHDASQALSQFKTTIFQKDTVLDDQVDIVFITSVGIFLAHADRFVDWDGIVIIFDCPVRCDGLVGITLLDVKTRTESFRYVFDRISPEQLEAKISAAMDERDDQFFHIRESNMIPYLLNRTSSSQMDRLQTWKYSIKNTELREVAMEKLIGWFFAPKPDLNALQTRLMTVLNLDKSKALDILFKDSKFPELKVAVLQVQALKDQGKSFSVDKIATKAGVSAFDIRYLMNVKARIDKGGDLDPPVPVKDVQQAIRKGTKCPISGLGGEEGDADEPSTD